MCRRKLLATDQVVCFLRKIGQILLCKKCCLNVVKMCLSFDECFQSKLDPAAMLIKPGIMISHQHETDTLCTSQHVSDSVR